MDEKSQGKQGKKGRASGFIKEALGDLSGIEEVTIFVNFLISGIKYLTCNNLRVMIGGDAAQIIVRKTWQQVALSWQESGKLPFEISVG